MVVTRYNPGLSASFAPCLHNDEVDGGFGKSLKCEVESTNCGGEGGGRLRYPLGVYRTNNAW